MSAIALARPHRSAKHAVRIQRFFLAAGAYGVCIPLLAIASWLGLIPARTVVEIGGVTRAVIAMAHSLKMSVVAEGVEHQNQFDLLRAEGCDEFQGYFCRPPMEEADLMSFLAEERVSRGLSGVRPSLATSP